MEQQGSKMICDYCNRVYLAKSGHNCPVRYDKIQREALEYRSKAKDIAVDPTASLPPEERDYFRQMADEELARREQTRRSNVYAACQRAGRDCNGELVEDGGETSIGYGPSVEDDYQKWSNDQKESAS